MPTVTPYVVGKMYRVPTMASRLPGKNDEIRWIPVIGIFHEDAKIVGFPDWHYHYDYRFLSDQQLKSMHTRRDLSLEEVTYSQVAFWEEKPNPSPLVVPRLRKCRRIYAPYPVRKARWLKKLEEAYADQKIDDKLVCPHKGGPLQGLTPDATGCVTCPLHGLRWRVESGCLAPWPNAR